MRVKLKRTMAAFLSVLVAFSMLVSGQAPMLVKAANATITVSFQNDADASEGKVEVLTGSNWESCGNSDTKANVTAIRITPNENYRIDWAATRLKIGENTEIEIKNDTNIQEALASISGYELTEEGTTYSLSGVEFAEDNSGGAPGQPGAEAGSLRFTCQGHAIEGGSIYYKLDDADSFTMVSEEGDHYASINVSTASAITIKFVAKSGYQLDTVRGVTVRADGAEKYTQNGEAVAEFAGEAGVKLDLASWVGEGNAVNSNFELEFGFGDANGGGANPEGGTPVSITIDDTILLQEGAPTSAYYSFEGVSNGKITIDPENSWGVPQITFDGYDGAGKTLKIEGTSSVSVIVKKGTTKLKGIELGEGAIVGFDAMDTEPEYPACLELAEGIHATDASNPAEEIRFANNIILNIGTENTPATTAFSGIRKVNLDNYEFHARDTINTVIYAVTAFSEVESVDIYCTKVKAKATSALFDRTAYGDTTDCIVHTEGEIQLIGAIGDGTLWSNYYFKYPDKAVTRSDMDETCNIPDCMRTYEITASDLSNGIAASENLDPGCILEKNGENNITLRSTDPILYSVSYQIDEGIQFPNPECGGITMNGFEKGFYMLDGTDERFEAWIAAGENVNVTILPDKGYQYQKDTLNINGQVISNATPGEDRGTYTFVMPANAGHICAGFAETSDIVFVTNNNIDNASIEDTEGAVQNGNAKLEIASADVPEEVAEEIASTAGDYTVAETLDVKLSESVVKNYVPGSGEQESWDTPCTELPSPVTINVELAGSLSVGASYEVVRVHNGLTEILSNTRYDAQTRTLTFQTDKFSTYAIAYKGTAGSTGGSSGGITTPSGGTTTDNTTTETKPDGTKVETSTETKTDGTKVETTVETKTDGTKTETVVETAKDGSVKTTETVTNADGSSTKTQKETETNAKGKEVEVTTVTQKDTQGNVAGITETSVIENIVGKADATVTVEKSATGEITSAQAEVNKNGSKSKSDVKGTLNGSVVSQITEAAGTKSVEISMAVKAGKKEYTVKADAEDITAGNKLKVMAIDPETGNYILVNAKTYTVSKAGSVSVTLPAGTTYQLLDSKEAAAVEKKILATVKVKKTSTTVEKGKKTSVQMSSKLDMDNVESITYSTSKKSVATVSKSGKVTAKNEGTVTITVTVILKNGKTKTVKMKINVK